MLQRVFVNSGLAAVDGVGIPNELKNLALVPPYAAHWNSFSTDEQKTLIQNHLAVHIHNVINTRDFPRDEALYQLMKKLEKAIRKLRKNSWCGLLASYGSSGIVPDKSTFTSLDPTEQVLLATDRTEWESVISPISEELISWMESYAGAIQHWHELKLGYFS